MSQRNWYGEHKVFQDKKIKDIDKEINWSIFKLVIIFLLSIFYMYFIILGRTI